MKRNSNIYFLFTLLCCILIIVITGCAKGSNETENIKENIAQEQSNTVSETAPDVNTKTEDNRLEFNELPDDIKGTIIPMDSLLLYHVETGKEYDKTDAYMFWCTLHYALGNFGVNYNRAEMTDYELAVESMVIGEFATSFIPEYNNPLPIPEELKDSIRYDDAEDVYYFGLGDRGLSQTEILSYEYIDNNTLKITARLFALDDDSTLCKGDFVLVRNDYASGVIEPLFYFTVAEAEFSN